MRPDLTRGSSRTTIDSEGWSFAIAVLARIARVSSTELGVTETSVITQLRGCGWPSSPASARANEWRTRFRASRTAAIVTSSPCQSSSS